MTLYLVVALTVLCLTTSSVSAECIQITAVYVMADKQYALVFDGTVGAYC
jgi:hypothetical protein